MDLHEGIEEIPDDRSGIRRLLDMEPAIIIAVVMAAVSLGVQFGWDASAGQQEAIKDFATAVLLLVSGVATRSVVWSPNSASELADEAYVEGVADAQTAADNGDPI